MDLKTQLAFEERFSVQMKHMEKLDSEIKEMNRYMANTVTQ